uniref:cleavage and polyadenylation specificity factor subunit 7-like isoform X2 n=1 Tax=Doryrhamphus excisus TaxID=161450 RepID=UPI0025AE1722|nr:cleavage and polyadenylation specificity factor subunit 7-like isoform X2 [Doryrhamphus excisus]
MHLTSQALGMAAAAGPSQAKKGAVYSDSNLSDEDLDLSNEADDLFDDAVLAGSCSSAQHLNVTSNAAAGRETPTKTEDEAVAVKNNEKEKDPSRKYCLYIGHFSWWTSDKDLMCVAQKLGVNDIHEIKFAENKTNGQSRGYAKVVVTSEESLKTLLEKIPQCTMDGKSIDCRFATHQNLSVFEDVANKRFPMRSNSRDLDPPEVPSSPRDTTPPSVPTPFPPHPLGNVFPSHPSPFLGQPPRPPFPPMPPGILPPPLFPPQAFSAPRQPSPSLHLNPAYFTPPPERQSSQAYSQQKQMSQKGERDYEELLNRNRAVASSAITKAVTGATTGDLRVAMETLLTAIAIIKQSSIYRDERCQALVTSLKDCLVSIQGNSSYSRSSSHSDSRDRERERDRHRESLPSWEGAGTSRRHRERSWSRERDRERLRDRHRDQRDRYR